MPTSSARHRLEEVGSGLIVVGGAAVLIAGFSAAQGGYFPTSWGWCALALCWAAGLALVLVSTSRLTALECGTLLALIGYTCWTAASIAWSDDSPQSVLDLERRLIYVVGLLAVLLLVRREAVQRLLAGTLMGIAAISSYGLSTRLFPVQDPVVDSVEGNRLASPIGYWNGLAIFAVIGIFLALGFAARGRGMTSRGAAAAVLPLLLTTLYFTYSRGGWMALVVGLLAIVALDARRLQLLTTALALVLPAAAAVLLASQSRALTAFATSKHTLRHDGRIFALELIGLSLVSAALAIALDLAERKVQVSRPIRIGYAVALALVSFSLVTAVVVTHGGPDTIVRKAYHSFKEPQRGARTSGDLNTRLFTLSSNGRVDQWRAAWHDYQAHPWLGSGSGSFESYWLQNRTVGFRVRDVHNLYLETLAELGPIGLGLLLVALGLPLVAAVRARHVRLVSAAFAAYVAFLAHAAVDWDWELAAITLAALLVAGSLLIAARGEAKALLLGRAVRVALVAALVAVAAFSAIGLVGNRALASATDAVDKNRWRTAEAKAHSAIRWAPWAAEAWQDLGDAQLNLGRRADAVKSLRKASRISPRDWRIWYDLSVAAKGAERARAFLRAESLNPLSGDIAVLRRRGYGRA
jgi:O-antigen ligase